MARKNNFLLGSGERLTSAVNVPTGGGEKNPPYSFAVAQRRVAERLDAAVLKLDATPADAAPNGEVVAVMTLHPRYISKSDYPQELLSAVGLRTIGSKTKRVKPQEWGVDKHPDEAFTEALFVAGPRTVFDNWRSAVRKWTSTNRGADQLSQVEDLDAFEAHDKVRGITTGDKRLGVLEVVLHNSGDARIIDAFAAYAASHGGEPLRTYRRDVRGLTFFPVRAAFNRAEEIARFSFVRVVRPMPVLRPLRPAITRTVRSGISLPPSGPTDPAVKAVIFDGGLPDTAKGALSRWVRYIEPAGIGKPDPALQEHGLAVTSAFLFGQIYAGSPLDTPICTVDHVRVLDENSGAGNDLMCLDVLNRILVHLDANPSYEFVNMSLGPRLPVEDDDITEWTAMLDDRFSNGRAVATVAVGNDGDATGGLNRIQPPGDGVNVLAVGAATSTGSTWQRADYSCIGPGRSPGYVKPDGLAFGGSPAEPFGVIGAALDFAEVSGTSVSSPLALRAASAVRVQLGTGLSPLAIRGLIIHRADPSSHNRPEVGWGRFEHDLERLITCDDDESVVLYQGTLPVGEHLRVPLAMPSSPLSGMVTVTATLVIAPDVDPQHPGAYTRSGLEVAFRPHSSKYTEYEDGKTSAHPKTRSFFSASNLYGAGEYAMREAGYKWEPCLRHTEKFRASTLSDPCFDIYYHHRQNGMAAVLPQPIPYAFVVSVRAPRTVDLYNQVVRTYQNILIPLRPQLRINVRTSA
jgi:hypothetical protein